MKKNFTLHSSWPYNLIPRGDSTHNNTIDENLYENYFFFFNLLVNEKL